MRRVASALSDLWQLIVDQRAPAAVVDVLRNADALSISLKAHYSVTWMVEQLVSRHFLKSHGVGRFRQVWWDAGCRVPPDRVPPVPCVHPATSTPRVAQERVPT